MTDVLGVFGGAVGPIVAIAAVGFLLARRREVDPAPLNTVVVYVLAPALVFHSLAVTELPGSTLLRLTVGVGCFTALMIVIGETIGRLTGDSEPLLSAFVLAVCFTNAGNLGVPVSDFAFGDVGRQTAVVFLTVQVVLMYTVGVYIASRSGGDVGTAGLRRVFEIPLVYAVVLALVLRYFGFVPPASSGAMESIGLVGDASIPVMLLILGIQLANTDYVAALGKASKPTLLKMALAPVVAVGVALVVGFGDSTVGRVFVLESSMPSAVTPLVLLVEFAEDERIGELTVPEYMSTVVLVTTLCSLPLLTGLIVLLQAGLVL